MMKHMFHRCLITFATDVSVKECFVSHNTYVLLFIYTTNKWFHTICYRRCSQRVFCISQHILVTFYIHYEQMVFSVSQRVLQIPP